MGRFVHDPMDSPDRRGVVGGVAALALGLALPRPALAEGLDAPPESPSPAPLPAPPRDDTVDVLHGVAVPDPFRPLESLDRPDVRAWVEAEAARGRAMLDALPLRASVSAFLEAANDYPRTRVPGRWGRRWFTWFHEGRAQQWSLGVQEGDLGAPRRTLLDPNPLSPDGTVGAADAVPDRRGARIAYLLAEAGSDRQVLRVRDVESGADLPDRLRWCKHTSIAWRPDGRSFYYTRYPAPGEPRDWDRRSHLVCLHHLGDPQDYDAVVLRLPALRDAYLELRASRATNHLRVTARSGTSREAGLYLGPLDPDAAGHRPEFRELVPVGRFDFWPVGNLGTTYYAGTTLDAPRGRIVAFDEADPAPERWRTLVPEPEPGGAIDGLAVFRDHLVVRRIVDVGHRLAVHDLGGRLLAEVASSGQETIRFGRVNEEDPDLLVGVEDYRRPARVERVALATGAREVVRPSAAPRDLADAVVRQVFVTARDGARVPMTLIHRADLAPDGGNRVLLTGYGGFGTSYWPGYSTEAEAWVRLGGVHAIASIRGGGEYGLPWHDAGRLARKQTSFDDFAACAEWLIAERITRPERLGITGASNGGLLVLATMLQRPDLFGAVVAAVPVTDMLRFHTFTFGNNWKPEYGDVDREADFRWLLAYSPLHTIRAGTRYPPLLVLTADHDDRVAPPHSLKFVATMRALCPEGDTHLVVERRAGHGGGNALSSVIERSADTIAFLAARLGGPVTPLPG